MSPSKHPQGRGRYAQKTEAESAVLQGVVTACRMCMAPLHEGTSEKQGFLGDDNGSNAVERALTFVASAPLSVSFYALYIAERPA